MSHETELHASSRLAPIVDYLRGRAGVYAGEGVNHEGETFRADFHLKMIAGGNAAQISFRARHGETTFHEERTWIASDLMRDRVALWTISTNTPGVLNLELRDDRVSDGGAETDVERSLAFAFGAPERNDAFREEIRLEFLADHSLNYIYLWGVPGEEFGPRSRSRLRKLEQRLPPSWL